MIPTGINKKYNLPAVTMVFTMLHAGGKFGGADTRCRGGTHGVGSSVVNALSTWLEVEVKNGKEILKQRYERGAIVSDLEKIGDTAETGTKVTFKPDPDVFTDTTEYDYNTLLTRLREQAFLNAGVKITLTDYRPDEEGNEQFRQDVLHYEGGIKSYVDFILEKSKKEALLPEVVYINGVKGDSSAEIAFQYSSGYDTKIISFANNIHTVDGGTHESAFKMALTRVVNAYARKFGMLKKRMPTLRERTFRKV